VGASGGGSPSQDAWFTLFQPPALGLFAAVVMAAERGDSRRVICPELSGQRIWVNSRCELPFYVFLVRLSRAPVLKPGVPTL
jgi:hypothetical protein